MHQQIAYQQGGGDLERVGEGECGYLSSKGIYGRKVMRTSMDIHLSLLCTSTEESLTGG